MSTAAELEIGPHGPGIDADALLQLGMPSRLRGAVARARSRLTGLWVITGSETSGTIAILARATGGTVASELSDRTSVGAVLEAAERGILLAPAAGGDAIQTILMLRRLAADRFALAATLRLLVAQRVVAGLCGACRRPEQAYGSLAALLGLDPGAILWEAPGCESCGWTGSTGRVHVFEGVEIDPAMRRLIYDGADAPLLARHAFLNTPNLASAARRLAREGLIAPEEAVRISRG
jgi:type II secretory ATPase GspE/PulE/Tfp pilus assembly ATPase PilB-like protein